jgi:hypothetical protein
MRDRIALHYVEEGDGEFLGPSASGARFFGVCF